MNNQIIPQGTRELINASASVVENALTIDALSDVPFTGLVYKFPKAPANADAITAGTLPAGACLAYVKSISLTTGLAEVVYQF